MNADRDRETRLAEIEAAIDEDGVCLDSDDARDLLRAAGEGDRLRRDLAALVADDEAAAKRARELRRQARTIGEQSYYDIFIGVRQQSADRLRALLDGGEGGR